MGRKVKREPRVRAVGLDRTEKSEEQTGGGAPLSLHQSHCLCRRERKGLVTNREPGKEKISLTEGINKWSWVSGEYFAPKPQLEPSSLGSCKEISVNRNM